jgi:hypothetical protein
LRTIASHQGQSGINGDIFRQYGDDGAGNSQNGPNFLSQLLDIIQCWVDKFSVTAKRVKT